MNGERNFKAKYVSDETIENSAAHLLVELGLFPQKPGTINVEVICDKKWFAPEEYIPLEDGIMGRALFSVMGIQQIEINATLCDDRTETGRRRIRSTLAHEIGHAILHEQQWIGYLQEATAPQLFSEVKPVKNGFECREQDILGQQPSDYAEVQANKFMAALLLPKKLVLELVGDDIRDFDAFGSASKASWQEEMIRSVAQTFDVSWKMAEIRLKKVMPTEHWELALK